MVSYDFYCNFITSFHEDYNGLCLRSLSWCHIPIEREDGYVEFIKRRKRCYVDTTFLAKFDFTKNQILIKCEYDYFSKEYPEKSQVNFELSDYKKNTYNSINIHGYSINYMADQEIQTFIKMFDYFYLEQQDTIFTKEQYDMYIRHLRTKPELFEAFSSSNCDFTIDVSYGENAFIVRFNYYDKLYSEKDYKEYLLYKNRTIGDDYNDMNNHVNIEISKRLDEINIDFMMFVEFRLK